MSRSYCVLGESLKHTMSPPIHKRLFDLKTREFIYDVVELKPEELSEKINELNSKSGYNITIPHKIGIIPFLDELDETAKRYGAVNCVDIKNGRSKGFNTDVDGFLRSLSSAKIELLGNILLVGSGGVGRMMAIETARAGAKLTIAVIEQALSEAQKVKSDILSICPDAEVKVITIDEISGSFDLLMNATPVGMYPKTDACVVSDEVIKNCCAVFDVIYNPRETLLMKKAKQAGITTVGGMAMLVWQAVSAHEIWDNDYYTDDEVFEIIREMEDAVARDFPV